MKLISSAVKTFVVTAALLIGLNSVMAAEEGPQTLSAGAKLTRGLVGLTFCWLEIPGQMYESAMQDGPGMAATVGFAKGLGMMCARAVTSTYEFVTFPFPINDFKPVMTPEYPWGYFATEGTITVPAATSVSQQPKSVIR